MHFPIAMSNTPFPAIASQAIYIIIAKFLLGAGRLSADLLHVFLLWSCLHVGVFMSHNYDDLMLTCRCVHVTQLQRSVKSDTVSSNSGTCGEVWILFTSSFFPGSAKINRATGKRGKAMHKQNWGLIR